jgi:hypothetical protein
LMMVHAKFLDYTDLLTDRVNQGLTKKSTADAFQAFEKLVRNRIAKGMSESEAVDFAVQIYSGSVRGRQDLVRMSTEFNLLARNTETAKIVANEVFFHHDLGRTLSEAHFQAEGNPNDTNVVAVLEQSFRSERSRAEEEKPSCS